MHFGSNWLKWQTLVMQSTEGCKGKIYLVVLGIALYLYANLLILVVLFIARFFVVIQNKQTFYWQTLMVCCLTYFKFVKHLCLTSQVYSNICRRIEEQQLILFKMLAQ